MFFILHLIFIHQVVRQWRNAKNYFLIEEGKVENNRSISILLFSTRRYNYNFLKMHLEIFLGRNFFSKKISRCFFSSNSNNTIFITPLKSISNIVRWIHNIDNQTIFMCPSLLSRRIGKMLNFSVFLWRWIYSWKRIYRLSHGKRNFHDRLSVLDLLLCVLEIDTRMNGRRLVRFLRFEIRERRQRRRKDITVWAKLPSGPCFSMHRCCPLCLSRPKTQNLLSETMHQY